MTSPQNSMTAQQQRLYSLVTAAKKAGSYDAFSKLNTGTVFGTGTSGYKSVADWWNEPRTVNLLGTSGGPTVAENLQGRLQSADRVVNYINKGDTTTRSSLKTLEDYYNFLTTMSPGVMGEIDRVYAQNIANSDDKSALGMAFSPGGAVSVAGMFLGGLGMAGAGPLGGVLGPSGTVGTTTTGGAAGGLLPGSAGSVGTIGTGMGVPVGGNMAGAGMGTGMYGGGAIGAGGYTSIPAAGLGPNVFNVGNIPSSPGGVSGGTNIGGVGTSANVTTNPFPGLTGATGPTGAPIAGNTLSFIDKIGLYFPSLGISNSTAMNIGGKLLSFLGSGQASQDQLDLLKQMQASNKAEFDRMMADSPYGPAAAAIIADILGGTSPGGQVVEAALREAQRLGAKGGYMGNSLNLADLSAQSLLRAGALSIEGAQVLANLYGTDLEALSNYLNTNMAYDTTRVHLTGQQPNWLNVAGKSLTALSGLLIPRG